MNRNRWKWLYSRDIISLTLAATLLFYWWAMVFRDIEPRWQDMRVGVDSRAPSSSSSPQIGKNDSIIREENTSLFHFDQRPSLESKRRPKEETPLGRTTTGGSTEGQNRLQKTRSTMISSLMSHTPHHRVIPRGRDCTSAGSCCRTTVQQRPTDLHTRVAFLLRHWNTPSFNPRDFNLSWSSSLRTVEATCILKIVGKHLIHNCDTCPRGRYHHAKAHMEIVRAAITWAQQHKRDIGDQQWVLTCSDKDFPTFPITDTPASPAPLNGFPPVSMAFQNNGLFYDVLFPTVTRGMFLPDRYAKNWQRRTSAARVSDSIGISRFATDNRTVWRGNVGCSIGCGPLGLFYNSTPDSIADVCDEGRARKSHPIKDPNVRGYTIGCDVDNYKAYSHPRIQLVEFSRNHPECGIDAGFVLPATEASKTLSRAFINAAGSPHWLCVLCVTVAAHTFATRMALEAASLDTHASASDVPARVFPTRGGQHDVTARPSRYREHVAAAAHRGYVYVSVHGARWQQRVQRPSVDDAGCGGGGLLGRQWVGRVVLLPAGALRPLHSGPRGSL
eukprot:m.145593 g.145593  ORF g.145593 m.145593 type:complete len:558 (-) comp17739_c0_seq2:453-2126(-)